MTISTGMKDIETKERFIELRGRGLPLAKIAAEINVSKPTLINWERDFREEIDNLQAVELEVVARLPDPPVAGLVNDLRCRYGTHIFCRCRPIALNTTTLKKGE